MVAHPPLLPSFRCGSSLYQSPRNEAQEASFRRAFADMSLYFAHKLVTCYILQGQDEHLELARSGRGWPLFEEAISMLLKQSPPSGTFDLHHIGRTCPLWPKVVQVSRTYKEASERCPHGALISRAAQRGSYDSLAASEAKQVGSARHVPPRPARR